MNKLSTEAVITPAGSHPSPWDANLAVGPSDKPVILVWGNCQAGSLGIRMGNVRGINHKYEAKGFRNFGVPGNLTPALPSKDLLDRCELLFLQAGLNEPIPEFAGYLNARKVRIILYPHVGGELLWPQHCQDTRNQTADPKYIWGRHPYGDRHLIDLMTKGGTVDEIVDQYLAMDLATLYPFDRLLEYWIKKCQAIDELCDVKAADFLSNNIQSKRLFYSINHPTEILTEFLTSEMLRTAGLDMGTRTEKESSTVDDWMVEQMALVHPSIGRALGLKWVNDDTRYQHYANGTFSLREAIRRYILWAG